MLDKARQELRELVYTRLEKSRVAMPPFPIRGRIPNFKGAKRAALYLTKTPEWQHSKIIKINPDSPQRPVRIQALMEKKILIMPTPRIRQGFLLLDGRLIPSEKLRFASTIRGAFIFGRPLRKLNDLVHAIEKIDFIVEGSVAVDKNCNRLGKGEGYGDIEYGILSEIGLVDETTPIATTVHDLQIVDKIPVKPHDVPIDIIATPTKLIKCKHAKNRPRGILIEYLNEEKIRSIPILQELLQIKKS